MMHGKISYAKPDMRDDDTRITKTHKIKVISEGVTSLEIFYEHIA